jgi:hypothetical protein
MQLRSGIVVPNRLASRKAFVNKKPLRQLINMKLRSGLIVSISDDNVKPVVATVKPVVASVKPVVATVKPVVASVKPVVATVKPVVATTKQSSHTTMIVNLLKKYVDYIQENKNKYYVRGGTLKQEKIYVLEMCRVLLELYSIVNEYFDIIIGLGTMSEVYKTGKFAEITYLKAIEFIDTLYTYRGNQRYTGKDLSLIKNCICEMENYKYNFSNVLETIN